LIEYLEVVASAGEAARGADLNDLVNQWDDWVRAERIDLEFPPPTYSDKEAAKLRAVCSALDRFCEATPQSIVDSGAEMRRAEWREFVLAAESALSEMSTRGRMAEDGEASS
jgi:hypothetical protein